MRWDHQKSDEFEATLRLNGEVLTGGLESNLKFARLLATDFERDLERATACAAHTSSPTFEVSIFDYFVKRTVFTDSLTSTYRSSTLF